jgi:filamentous hemagglutinin family protein
MHETFRKTISLLIIVSFVCLPIHSYADPAPNALPSGGEVIEGAGVIGQAYDRQGTATLDVTQSDQRIIAEWVSFDIGRAAEVNFRQPGASAVALNKIYQGSPSEIFGALNANGQIFLVNTNGIVFGPGSQLDVAGLVASTLNIDNEDFMNGQYTFTGQGGAVMNAGDLMAPGGFIALLGSQVANSGTIVADMGSVALASGEKITVGLDGRNLISVAVDEAVTQHLEKADAAVENTGTLQAKGGKVVLTAKSLDGIFDNAINTEGIVEASAMNEVNGEIVIKSDQRSAVSGTMRANGGTINISSKGADLTGNMSADLITARMFGASSNLSGVYAGNVVFSDPGDIYVTDDLTINAQGGNCSLTITAMDGSSSVPGGETGSFYQTNGTISTTSDKTGDIIINGYNVTLGAISSAGDLIVNAQQDILDDGDMNTVASADTIDLTADGTVGGFNDAGNTLNAAIAPLLDVDFSEEFIVDADALYFLQHVAGPHTLDFTRYDFEIENEIFAAVDNTLNIASTPPGFTLGDVIFLALGDLNVSTDLTADSGDSEGGLVLAATDDLNVNGDISMHTYLDLEADAEENGTGSVNIGAVDLELTKGGQIYLNGSGINILSGAALDAEGDGTNYSNIAIEPGQPTGTLFVGDGGIGDVTITQAEYDTFIADEVVFGDEQGDDMTLGDITAGDLDSSISRLSLRTNGNIWDDGNSATMLKADTIILKALNGNIGSVNDAATDFDTIVAPMLDIQLGSGNLEALAQEDGEIYIAEHKGGSWNLNENTVAAYNFDYANNVADMGILGNLDGSLTLNMDPNQVDVDTNFAFVANGDITVQQAVESTAGFMGLFAADNVVINAKIAAVDEIEIEAGVDGSNGIGSISGLGVIDTSVLLLKAYAGINMGTPMTINELDATNTGTGDIDLTNDGDLLAASVINEAAGGEVNLTVNSDLTVGQITAPTVNLTASTGSIYDDAVDEAGDPEEPAGAGFAGYTTIEADAVTLTANGHIGYVPDFDASDFPEFLDIDLSPGGTLAVDNSGAGYPGQILLNFVNPSDFHTSRITSFNTALGETQIIIANTVADMIVDDALDLSGDELSLAGSNVVIGNDITANDIFISAFSDIIMNSGVVSADNDLELYANFVKPFFGFADDSQGGIIYNGGTAEAGWLSLKAATGIGTETDPVQTEAGQLDETYNTTNGGIYVQNAGALVLREITDSSAAGDINIQTTGDMRLDDTIETSGSVSLRSTNGKMTDGNPTVPDDDDAAGATLNVVAPSITLRAHGDIGASDNLVEIDAPSQSLTSDTGAVYVSNLSALGQIILDEVISAGGVFEAVHAEHIWAKNVVHQGGADTDDIVIRSLQGDIEVDVIHAFGLGDIILESVMGRIMDENGTPSDVEGDGLTMTAKYGIGSSGNPINTEVNTINATAHQGSVYINEADGVTVESIQALGNTTIDLDTGGNTTIHDLTAAGPAPEPALITVDVSSGDLNVVGDVLAENYGSADAKVGMTAHNGQLNVYDAATITARTTTQADAEVDLNAYSGSVDISEASQIKSRLWTGGQALIDINASDSIDITEDSLLEALLQNILVDELEQPMPAEGEANIFLRAGGDLIDIANAELRAQVIGTGAARIRVDAQEDQQIRDAVLLSSIQNGSDTSSIELHSYTGNISMNNGDLTAEVLDNGDAEIRITADPGEGEGTGRFSAYADSEINAAVQGHGSADIYIESEATTISDSDVIAEIGSGDNTSKINISSQNGGALNLNGALVRALVDQDGTAEIGLHNWPQTGDTTTNNNEMTDSVIEAVVNGLGKAYLDLESGHDLIFDNTQVRASVGSGRQIQGDWDARIDLEAINHVHVTQGSQLSAEVLTDGDAQVSFNMNPCQEDPSCNEGAVPNDVGDLLISTSLVQSVVNGEGKAWINNNPEGSVTIENNSTVLAQINDNGGDNDHEASVNLNTRFNGNFTVHDSSVIAEALNNGNAYTSLKTDNDAGSVLEAANSYIAAKVGADGTSFVTLRAYESLNVLNSKNGLEVDKGIEAYTGGSGQANIDIETKKDPATDGGGGDILVQNADIRSTVVDEGRAIVDLDARDSQFGGNVTVEGNSEVNVSQGTSLQEESSTPAAISVQAGNIDLDSSTFTTDVTGNYGQSYVNLFASGLLNITDMDIATNAAGYALKAGDWVTAEQINILDSRITADVAGGSGPGYWGHYINLDGGQDITITNSELVFNDTASAETPGKANVRLISRGDIQLTENRLLSSVIGDGAAGVWLTSAGTLNVVDHTGDNRYMKAAVSGEGSAKVNLDVYDALTVRNSQVFTHLGSGHNRSLIWMESDIGPILIEDSDLESIVENDGRSEIWVSTQPVTEGLNDIVVDNSDITSWVKGFGSSKIALGSEDDLHVINGSAIESRINSGVMSTDVDSDAALVRLEAVGDLYVTAGPEERTSVSALVDDSGHAFVNFNMNPRLESRDEGAFDNETGSINIDGVDIQSKVLNAEGYAEVSLNAEGPVDIQDTDIDVERQFGDYLNDYGNSLRIFSHYGDDITISESELTTWITGSGNNAKMSIVTDVEHNGDIQILDSSLLAKIQDEGHAEVYAQARAGDVIIGQGSSISTEVGAGADTSLIILRGVRSIQVKNSFLTAQILHDGQAQTDLRSSEGYVEVENSTLRSDVQGDGHAKTYVESNANNEGTDLGIRVLNGSLYSDVDGEGYSEVWLNAKDSNLQILDALTTVRATITNGDDSYDHNAYVKLSGDDVTINYSNLYARVKEQGDALVWIGTKNDGLLSIVNGSGIDSLVSGKGDADITVIADGTGGIDIRDSNFFVQTPDQRDTTRGNQIKLQALSDIDITDSYFISRLDNTPDDPENFQYLTMTSSEGDIHLSGSTFEDQVVGNGVTYMRFKAEDGSVYVDESTFLSESVADRFGEVGFHGLADDGVVEVKNSTVNAHVGGNGRANIKAEAYDAIDLDNSTLRSQVDGEGEGRVFLTLYNGDITNELLNDSAAGIFANYLTLTAGGSIGSSEDRLQTDVDGITAIAYEGDVFINEADGVVLENIQAQNNTLIDIITHGDTEVHDMTAAGPAPGTKGIYLDVHNGDVDVLGEVRAQCFGSADAEVVFQVFDGALNVDGGTIQAMTTNPTYALVILHTQGLITLDNAASVYAEAWNSGDASVTLIAEEAGVDLLGASSVKAAVLDEVEGAVDGDADIYITAGAGDVDMANATVTASIEDPGDDAHSEIDIMAWDGSILGGPDSLISAEFAGLLAQNDIGTSARPVQTDVDYVTAYSFAPVPASVPAASETSPTPEEGSEDGDGVTVTPTVEIEEEGSIYIQEADDLTVGFFMNDENETAVLGSVAANNGIVHITAQGDMLVHSVVTPRGGAYLQSLFGSVYAGNGWASLTDWAGPYQILQYNGPAYFTRIASRAPAMDLLGSPLEPEAAARYMMPYAIVGVETESSLEEAPNLIAGGFSYVSTPNGTIGVGTPDAKDPAVSGEVRGSVSPLITTVNDDDGIGLDLRLGVPPGYVTYQEDNETPALQIWPEIVPPGSPATAPVPLVNPLWVFVKADSSSHSAVPEGFPEGDDALAGLTLQIGNELLPAITDEDGAEIIANNFMENLRAYYELLDQYRVTTMQPIVPTEYYAYHPIAAADSSAFDEIQLDAGAYEYIDGNLSPNSPLAPFFGEEEEEEE